MGLIQSILYRLFGLDSFTLIYRYDMTTGSLGELYGPDGRFVTLVLSNLKPDTEYYLKSNQFEYDEFTNRLGRKLKLDPKLKIRLPRNICLSVIDKRSNVLAY